MRTTILIALLAISVSLKAQFVNNTACDNPGFSSTTIYTFFQPHSKLSIGFESGYWNGEIDSRFSFFGGFYIISMDSIHNANPKRILLTPGGNFALYEKTQIRIIPNYLYAEVSPEMINPLVAFKFEVKTGLRVTIPIADIIGIGIEGGYAYLQKQYYGVFNIHIAFQ